MHELEPRPPGLNHLNRLLFLDDWRIQSVSSLLERLRTGRSAIRHIPRRAKMTIVRDLMVGSANEQPHWQRPNRRDSRSDQKRLRSDRIGWLFRVPDEAGCR